MQQHRPPATAAVPASPCSAPAGRKPEWFILAGRWIVNIHPAMSKTKVVEPRKEQASRLRGNRQLLLSHQGGSSPKRGE